MRPTSDLPGADQPINGDRPGERLRTDKTTDKRVTVADAAVLLGISEDAVRSRLRRGTLRRGTAPDGTVFVLLGASTGDRPATPQRPTNDRSGDQRTTDKPTDQGAEGTSTAKDPARGELLEVLRNDVAHLRDQLDQERDANRENRRIIAGLVQRVPEIEAPRDAPSHAPSEPRDGPEMASEEPEKGTEKGTTTRDVDSSEPRRSWLHRFFFGP
jgi:hypothetical protein